jgi:hypothetical protein
MGACKLVSSNHCFEGACCLHLQGLCRDIIDCLVSENGGYKLFLNFGCYQSALFHISEELKTEL